MSQNSTMFSIYETLENVKQTPVVFDKVLEQYVKDQDVIAYFSVPKEINVNENDDRIGLMRIGTTNMKDCLTFAEIHFDEISESDNHRHGTATFPSSILPTSTEEMYQFCYLTSLLKNLGTSISFQLNFEADDIDILTNSLIGRDKTDSLVAFADHDDDVIVIQSKRAYVDDKLRKENRQLNTMNKQLEMEKVEIQTQLKLMQVEQKEIETKFKADMQVLTDSYLKAKKDLTTCQQIEAELRTECEKYRSQCDQYKTEIDELSKTCQQFEENQTKVFAETNQFRRQLATSEETFHNQQLKLAELERRLLEANETNATLTQRHSLLEQQIRELRASSDKQQLNVRTQVDEYNRQVEQRENQLKALQEAKRLYQQELNTIKSTNENLSDNSQQDKILVQQLQNELEQYREYGQQENGKIKQQLIELRTELNEKRANEMTLAESMKEIEKRCVKHRKQEVEAKRQLTHYEDMIKDLKEEITNLKQRLIDGGEKYQNLYRNFKRLEESMKVDSIEIREEVPQARQPEREPEPEPEPELEPEPTNEDDELDRVLNNTAPTGNNQEQRSISLNLNDRASLTSIDGAVKTCPVCEWEFPKNLTLEGKREHIEEHFADNQ